MATETITGCVDYSTGNILFYQDTCQYDGCMIWDGIHVGQVGVTIIENCCDDTYYGCINWSTLEFQVVVPTLCCVPCGLCNDIPCSVTIILEDYTLDECSIWEMPSGKSRKVIGANIVGAVNGTHVCEFIGEDVSGPIDPYSCQWIKTISAASSNIKLYNTVDCTGATTSDINFEFAYVRLRYFFSNLMFLEAGLTNGSSFRALWRAIYNCDGSTGCICSDGTFNEEGGQFVGGSWSWS